MARGGGAFEARRALQIQLKGEGAQRRAGDYTLGSCSYCGARARSRTRSRSYWSHPASAGGLNEPTPFFNLV
ncbi:hypothetical protein AMELA_G00264410 [Ameiurus melas]|uniref:Uncharacterized protein n=1 Tax=Ameiurus melas TaxID=219545 RepID=A0A7J5ZSE3_AMEME|nr:hypothetical protein AMELA_G00264410 [Ameiurus melas]